MEYYISMWMLILTRPWSNSTYSKTISLNENLRKVKTKGDTLRQYL